MVTRQEQGRRVRQERSTGSRTGGSPFKVVTVLALGLCLLAASAAPKGRRPARQPADLKVERRFRDGGMVRILSWGLPPGGGRIELWNSARKRVDVVQTGRIEGARLIERDTVRPLLEVVGYSYGTAYQSTVVIWLCMDRGKLEIVLDLPESVAEVDDLADGREELKTSYTVLYGVSNLKREKWPVLHARTLEARELFDRTGKTLASSQRSTEAVYHFDVRKRAYVASPEHPGTNGSPKGAPQ